MLGFARRLWCRILGPRFQLALGGLGGSSCCCCNVTFQCSPAGPQPGVTIDDPISGFSVAGTISPAGKVTLAIPGDGTYDVTFSGPACPGDIAQSMDLACGQTYPSQCCGGQCGGSPTICLYQTGYVINATTSCPPSVWGPGGAGPPPVMAGAQVTIKDPTGKIAFQGTTDATGCVVYDLHEIVQPATGYSCTMTYAGQTASLPAGVFATCLDNLFSYDCGMMTGCYSFNPAPIPPGIQGTVDFASLPGSLPALSSSRHTDQSGCVCVLNGYPAQGVVGSQPDSPRFVAYPPGGDWTAGGSPLFPAAAPGFRCVCCNIPSCNTLRITDSVIGDGTLLATAGGWFGYIYANYQGLCSCPAGVVPVAFAYNCSFPWDPQTGVGPLGGSLSYGTPQQGITAAMDLMPLICTNLMSPFPCPGFVEPAGVSSQLLSQWEVSFSCEPAINDTWTRTMDHTAQGAGMGCPCYVWDLFGNTDPCGCAGFTSCPNAPIGEWCWDLNVFGDTGVPTIWGDAPTAVTWNIVDEC